MRFKGQVKTSHIWLFIIGAALFLGIGIMVWGRRPIPVEVFPAPQSAPVSAHTPLKITFSRAMLPATVSRSLVIDPPQSGEFTWEANAVTFTPDSAWPRGRTVTVTITTGARSKAGLPLAGPFTWSFQIANTLLAYLWPADGPADLYSLDPVSGETRQLSHTPEGVLDYRVGRTGASIVVSALKPQGGSVLQRLDLITGEWDTLFDCGVELCRALDISPGGELLAFENASTGQVWLLPAGTNDPFSVGETQLPSWSSGGLLMFYNQPQLAYQLYDPATGNRQSFSNRTGEPGAWSPDGLAFVAAEVLPSAAAGGPVSSHLMKYDRLSELTADLTMIGDVEDTSPAFSPDGTQLAFARKFLDATRWSPGRQLWLMTPDGQDARPVTAAPQYNHSAFAWHPEGDLIAYVRSNQTTINEPPEIWLIHPDGSQPLRLVIGGYNPQWIP